VSSRGPSVLQHIEGHRHGAAGNAAIVWRPAQIGPGHVVTAVRTSAGGVTSAHRFVFSGPLQLQGLLLAYDNNTSGDGISTRQPGDFTHSRHSSNRLAVLPSANAFPPPADSYMDMGRWLMRKRRRECSLRK
jgi:hypothetical protein